MRDNLSSGILPVYTLVMGNITDPSGFYVIANNLSLDFVNSISHELTLENLLGWSVAADLVTSGVAQELSVKWRGRELSEILGFRTKLRETVVGLANGQSVSANELSEINSILRIGGYAVIETDGEFFRKVTKVDLDHPINILVPVAESFADLLCCSPRELIRKCERPECILYFYDTTKNHRRRWCSMSVCGNRAKVARFHRKTRPS